MALKILFDKIEDLYNKIFTFLTILFTKRESILNDLLESKDIFIFTNDFCSSEKESFLDFITFNRKCNLSKIDRIIDFEKEKDIYFFLKTVKKTAKIIIHTEGGNSEYSDFIPYILKQNKIKIITYIPEYAYSAGSFIAIPSDTIYLNWYSSMGPVDTQLDYDNEFNDEQFPAKYIKNLKNKDDAVIKLKSVEAKGYHLDDVFMLKRIIKNKRRRNLIIKHFLNSNKSHKIKYGPKDLKKFGLNIKIGIDKEIIKIFNLFKELLID
tara:strand:- start:791 stop:1588 length:798 start_codon:yes stop_codon:yes gene_type:complete